MGESIEVSIPPSEVGALVAAVVNEAREKLAGDRWRMLRNENTFPVMYSAAGLAHCCVLAEQMLAAHTNDQELVGRMLARALFETWAVSYFVQLGGPDALAEVAADFTASIKAQLQEIKVYDNAVRKRRKAYRKKKRHRERTGESPDVQEPDFVESGFLPDELFSMGNFSVPPKKLPLIDVIRRIGKMTEEAGTPESFELAYQMAYRSLSSFGAHPSMWVLDCYLDSREGTAIFIRIREDAEVPGSFDVSNSYMALFLLCGLSVAVIESRDGPCRIAQDILDRFNPASAPTTSGGAASTYKGRTQPPRVELLSPPNEQERIKYGEAPRSSGDG